MFRNCNRTKSVRNISTSSPFLGVSRHQFEDSSSSYQHLNNGMNEQVKPKFSLEQQLEILEKLEKGDFDRKLGTEQWKTQFDIKPLHLRPNLTHLHEMFGSVPMDLGKSVLSKSRIFRGTTFSGSEMNLPITFAKNQNINNNDVFEAISPIPKTTNDSPGVISNANSDSDFEIESSGEFDEQFNTVCHELLNCLKIQKKVRKRLWNQQKMEPSRYTLLLDQSEDLAGKMEDISKSIQKLKIKDQFGALDVNKLMRSPPFGKSTYFIPCPVEKHNEIVNGLTKLQVLVKEISVLQKKADQFAKTNPEEHFAHLEKMLDDLLELLSDEEKNNREWMETVQCRKLFDNPKSNDASSNESGYGGFSGPNEENENSETEIYNSTEMSF